MSAFSSNEHIKDREKKYSKNFQFLKQKIELKKKDSQRLPTAKFKT
jgi:hypothetical protein